MITTGDGDIGGVTTVTRAARAPLSGTIMARCRPLLVI